MPSLPVATAGSSRSGDESQVLPESGQESSWNGRSFFFPNHSHPSTSNLHLWPRSSLLSALERSEH